MNPKSSPLGSIWRKWDLHFHTPASYDYEHKGATNQEIVDGLVNAGVEVVAITDHHRIETARIIELQKLGGTNLTVLPGIEFRSELGGSDSVHFIGIFPEDANVVDLWTKLSGKLNITEAEVAKRGDDTIYCPFVETARVIHDLGGLLSVHAGKKSNSIEGLKNSDYIKQIIKKDLVRECIDIYEVGAVTDIRDYVEKVIASFENEEYKAINADLGNLNKELQGLRNWRSRLEALIRELRVLRAKQNFPPSENPNAYEAEFFALLKSINDISAPVQGRASLAASAAREAELAEAVAGLKQKLEAFLKGRGLSQENLADVGKANERVAQIEQELPAQKAGETEIAAQIAAFTPKRELTAKRAATVAALLEPLNKTLSQLGKEVRAIELRYEFDETQFEQAMTKHIQERLGENAPRIDYLGSMLEDVDFANLTTREDFVSKLPEKQATAKLLRDYFSVPLNFGLLKVEAEKKLMDFGAFGRIRVSYDGKPVESSSFGQRCTTAIVILLLLGNTPIVIDEPEAHLDSALIANYLVELVKTAKLNRQIIFATHNANFVVNRDAELIHALEMGNDKVTKIQSITIEDLVHRAKLLALEGGPEAFLKREHRYGIA